MHHTESGDTLINDTWYGVHNGLPYISNADTFAIFRDGKWLIKKWEDCPDLTGDVREALETL